MSAPTMIRGSSQASNDWDAEGYADSYQIRNTPSYHFFQSRSTIVMGYLKSIDKGSVLDVGCGPGIYAPLVRQLGHNYIGIDISPKMIEVARKRFASCADFEICDALHLPFKECSFDAVLCLGMFEYISPGEEESYLRELRRVVKPEGVIVLSYLNVKSPYWFWLTNVFPLLKFCAVGLRSAFRKSRALALRDCAYETPPTRKFALKKQIAVLLENGLSTFGANYYALNMLPPPLGTKFPHQSSWLSSKLEHLAKTNLLGWTGMAFVVAVRKTTLGQYPLLRALPITNEIPSSCATLNTGA
jgi:ubiquinone/menaquinone biosynthesis C-methylase UbiE